MQTPIVIKSKLQASVKAAAGQADTPQLTALCDLLESATCELDASQQLWIAGDILHQIIELFHARSQRLFDTLDVVNTTTDPIVPKDLFQGLVRQSMTVDFSDLIAPTHAPRQPTPPSTPQAAIALADWLATLPPEPTFPDAPTLESIKALASVEAVSDWQKAIESAMAGEATTLSVLQTKLTLSLVEIWLGLVLGGFKLQPLNEAFYGTDCYVYLPEKTG